MWRNVDIWMQSFFPMNSQKMKAEWVSQSQTMIICSLCPVGTLLRPCFKGWQKCSKIWLEFFINGTQILQNATAAYSKKILCCDIILWCRQVFLWKPHWHFILISFQKRFYSPAIRFRYTSTTKSITAWIFVLYFDSPAQQPEDICNLGL